MSEARLIEWVIFIAILCITTPLLGSYMFNVFAGRVAFLRTFENVLYRLCGIHSNEEMDWKGYAKALLLFNVCGFLFLFILLMAQGHLFLNPQNFAGLEWTLAFNTAISFVTNTNWQSYAGESTMSYLSQMVGLTPQNFLSAATGNAVLLAFIRGLQRKTAQTLGNVWVDITRTVLYVLLPLSIIVALILVSQGTIQNLHDYLNVTTFENAQQTIPMGPVASQVAIKQLGSNGGGFFNANSAHPFENPSVLSNFIENLAILLIPAAATYMYGCMVGSKKQGWVIFGVMIVIWLIGFSLSLGAERINNPILNQQSVLEGKETRFGTTNSVAWSTSTTATSNGSVNAMHSSLAPLAGGIAMLNIMLGEVIFGGVGVGMCGMLKFIILTVFLAGLMVGRTPEYLGKKIEKNEIRWVMIAILSPFGLVLLGAGFALLMPDILANLTSKGPHGLSEILYAYASAAGNNGSAFAGLDANTTYFNLTLGFVMLLARLAILVPSLAVAGCLVQKKMMVPSLGTFSTDRFLFGFLLACIILVFGALTFFPALALGPIVEHMLMIRGQSF